MKVKEVTDLPDGGTLEFNGNYDPSDVNGQQALAAVCVIGTHLTDLYLYVNVSTFWRVKAGGYIIINKAKAISLPRSGFGTISFSGDVSSEEMEQVGVGA